ncbi:MAG: helix-turn-helix transcriptional regulator [Bacteroidota bacterium]
MVLDKNYNPQKHYAEIQNLINQKVGAGVFPDNQEVINFWKAVSDPMPPRTFMYIYSLNDDISFRSKGFAHLGLPDNWTFSGKHIIGLTHENQCILVTYQTLLLYKALLNHPTHVKGKGVEYYTYRGMKKADEKDTYLLVHQLAYPVQYDANGYVAKYFCSYRIIGPYRGEPLETYVYTDSKFPKSQKLLNKVLQASKHNMLGILGLQKAEEEVLEYMAYTDLKTSRQIADHLDLSPNTIRNHKNSINRKAKQIFPLNNFSDTNDVILYLRRQLMM